MKLSFLFLFSAQRLSYGHTATTSNSLSTTKDATDASYVFHSVKDGMDAATGANYSYAVRTRGGPVLPGSIKKGPDTAAKSGLSFPVLDALVAGGALMGAPVDISQAEALLDCAMTHEETLYHFHEAIPKALDLVLNDPLKVVNDGGRIVQYTDTSYKVAENYEVTIRGTTLSCFVVDPADTDYLTTFNATISTMVGGAAYASDMVLTELAQKTGSDADYRDYNISILVEADVIELPIVGLLVLPRRYCLDLERTAGSAHNGISGGPQTYSFLETITRTESVTVETSTLDIPIVRNRNRMVKLDMVADENIGNFFPTYHTIDELAAWMKHAYRDSNPKAEMLALFEAIRSGYNLSFMIPCHQLIAYGIESEDGSISEDSCFQSLWELKKSMQPLFPDVTLEILAMTTAYGSIFFIRNSGGLVQLFHGK